MVTHFIQKEKKIVRPKISPEHTQEILAEMCKRVGVDAEMFDFDQKDWYWQHEWTLEEQDDFRKWLGKFLKKHKYVGPGKKRGQDWGYYEAGKIIFNYGWKTKT